MPPYVAAALSRLRRRVAAGAFVGGVAVAVTALASVAAAAALALRLAGVALPGATVPVAWSVVCLGALVAGLAAARRVGFGDRDLAAHLERRLPTGGLLLAAVDGAQLAPAFAAQLRERLDALPAALPRLRWRALSVRPLMASALLAAVTALPAPSGAAGPGAATTAAVERLVADIEQVAALPTVPPELAEELRRTGEDLARRAADGATELWREIDQLDARLERERRLAGVGEHGAATATDGNAPGKAALAQAMQQLAGAAALDRALGGMSPELRDRVAGAISSDGVVDPQRLPDDAGERSAIAAALGSAAEQLLADPAALASLAESLGADGAASRVREALAEVAASFGEADSASERAGGDQGASLAGGLAEAAAQIAAGGGLDLLPEALRAALAEAAIDAAMGAASSLDLERLAALLPKDPKTLRGLAEAARSLAERMAGAAGGSSPSLPQLSAAAQERLAASAASLAAAMGGAGSALAAGAEAGAPGGDGRGAAGQGSGGEGNAGEGPGGSGAGVGRGPGNVALRLTGDAAGGVGENELALVGPDQSGELPREWMPVESRKVEPEVGEGTTAPVGRAPGAAAGGGADAAGGPAFELRLRPRHRDLVRRYFGTDKR